MREEVHEERTVQVLAQLVENKPGNGELEGEEEEEEEEEKDKEEEEEQTDSRLRISAGKPYWKGIFGSIVPIAEKH